MIGFRSGKERNIIATYIGENKDGLEKDARYEVEEISMGQSHTSIYLKWHKGVFNSIDFTFEEDGKEIDIFKDKDFNPYI